MSLQSLFENLTAPLLALWPHLVFAAAILVLGLVVAIVAQKVILRLLRHATPEIRLFAGRLAYIGIVIGAILGALAASGVHIAAMATLIGALGLAVSLSLQDTANIHRPGRAHRYAHDHPSHRRPSAGHHPQHHYHVRSRRKAKQIGDPRSPAAGRAGSRDIGSRPA